MGPTICELLCIYFLILYHSILTRTLYVIQAKLVAHHTEHGNTSPKQNRNLKKWCSKQRSEYGHNRLEDLRIQKLKSIGFRFHLYLTTESTKDASNQLVVVGSDKVWDKNFVSCFILNLREHSIVD